MNKTSTDPKPFRVISVKYYSPTNTKGARIRIKDESCNVAVFLPFDYAANSTAEQAIDYLEKRGLKVDARLLAGGLFNSDYLGASDFVTPIK
jgi:hypothetical protein